MKAAQVRDTGDFYTVYLLGVLIAAFIFLMWFSVSVFWVFVLIMSQIVIGFTFVPMLLGIGGFNLENEWLGFLMGVFSMITLLILLLIVLIRRNRKINGN